MSTLGDQLTSINTKNRQLTRTEIEGDYVPYIVNRTLSYFLDTVAYANELQRNSTCPIWFQYLFYYHGVRKNKRFSKWHKVEDHKYLELVKEYYGYSTEKARDAIKLLSNDQLKIIKDKLDKGGRR